MSFHSTKIFNRPVRRIASRDWLVSNSRNLMWSSVLTTELVSVRLGFDFFDGRESFINYHADANEDIFALL